MAQVNTRIPDPGLLSIPLVFVYCFVVGLRLVFEIPADLRANWIFKLLIDPGKAETARLARSLVCTILAPCLLVIYFPICVYEWGWQVAALHIAFVSVMSALLVETMMGGLRKIPFTCSPPVFKENAFVVAFLLLFGFYVFVEGGSFLEYLALLFPIRVILALLALGVWWMVLRQYGANRLEIDKRIIFEEGPVETVQLLGLETRN